ncbi:hypothetical protein EMCRGX_G032030 [Ephydatia muelleri]
MVCWRGLKKQGSDSDNQQEHMACQGSGGAPVRQHMTPYGETITSGSTQHSWNISEADCKEEEMQGVSASSVPLRLGSGGASQVHTCTCILTFTSVEGTSLRYRARKITSVVVEHQSVRFTPALAHLDPKLSSPLWMELSEMHSKEDHMGSSSMAQGIIQHGSRDHPAWIKGSSSMDQGIIEHGSKHIIQ